MRGSPRGLRQGPVRRVHHRAGGPCPRAQGCRGRTLGWASNRGRCHRPAGLCSSRWDPEGAQGGARGAPRPWPAPPGGHHAERRSSLPGGSAHLCIPAEIEPSWSLLTWLCSQDTRADLSRLHFASQQFPELNGDANQTCLPQSHRHGPCYEC